MRGGYTVTPDLHGKFNLALVGIPAGSGSLNAGPVKQASFKPGRFSQEEIVSALPGRINLRTTSKPRGPPRTACEMSPVI